MTNLTAWLIKKIVSWPKLSKARAQTGEANVTNNIEGKNSRMIYKLHLPLVLTKTQNLDNRKYL
jgi:hypothetical protein